MSLVSTPRVELLRDLREEITHNYPAGRTIVAVDGIAGSGTAAFADGLADVFREADRAAFRASIDDFHRPREERYARGRDSAEGYYHDSFDYSLLRRVLIEPFRLAGGTGFQLAGFDEKRDTGEELRWVTGPKDAVLIVDGVFLHRPELRGLWHYSIWLDVPFSEAYRRLAESLGADPDPQAASNARYVGGQQLYQREANPRTSATAVVNNSVEASPVRVFLDSC
ncbi:uridine kinase [Mycetocola zhujimingii]|uniref:Uridine kinase n=1 Tax=Mycetocola zhujimingii TaxID=2079792 RepID=A0A2U1TEH0_9MICO|nr:uridine kinase [Mycetocola zhujimingii]PWC07281.1 uridine kinase [Mycetocola zhujimingii]